MLMKYKLFLILFLALSLFVYKVHGSEATLVPAEVLSAKEEVLAKHEMSLETRYAVPSVNEVFKDNILLTLAYMTGKVQAPSDISWDALQKDATYEITLKPGEVFAFHDDVLPAYKDAVVKTTNAHFDSSDGFKSDGYLYGDGVCHLASIINWTARDAGLAVESRVNHDFANIPEVPREYGTSIITTGSSSYKAQAQNLYVKNTFDKPVKMVFIYKDKVLKVEIFK